MKIEYSNQIIGMELTPENVHDVFQFCRTNHEGIEIKGDENWAVNVNLFGNNPTKKEYPEAHFYHPKMVDPHTIIRY
jgi:hypothetical protein